MPIFKKVDKKDSKNDRGITLLSTVFKVITKILAQRIELKIEIYEVQQSFRHNSLAKDAIFVLRQLVEKGIELEKPVFMVELKQAFDRMKLTDVVKIVNDYDLNTQ